MQVILLEKIDIEYYLQEEEMDLLYLSLLRSKLDSVYEILVKSGIKELN